MGFFMTSSYVTVWSMTIVGWSQILQTVNGQNKCYSFRKELEPSCNAVEWDRERGKNPPSPENLVLDLVKSGGPNEYHMKLSWLNHACSNMSCQVEVLVSPSIYPDRYRLKRKKRCKHLNGMTLYNHTIVQKSVSYTVKVGTEESISKGRCTDLHAAASDSPKRMPFVAKFHLREERIDLLINLMCNVELHHLITDVTVNVTQLNESGGIHIKHNIINRTKADFNEILVIDITKCTREIEIEIYAHGSQCVRRPDECKTKTGFQSFHYDRTLPCKATTPEEQNQEGATSDTPATLPQTTVSGHDVTHQTNAHLDLVRFDVNSREVREEATHQTTHAQITGVAAAIVCGICAVAGIVVLLCRKTASASRTTSEESQTEEEITDEGASCLIVYPASDVSQQLRHIATDLAEQLTNSYYLDVQVEALFPYYFDHQATKLPCQPVQRKPRGDQRFNLVILLQNAQNCHETGTEELLDRLNRIQWMSDHYTKIIYALWDPSSSIGRGNYRFLPEETFVLCPENACTDLERLAEVIQRNIGQVAVTSFSSMRTGERWLRLAAEAAPALQRSLSSATMDTSVMDDFCAEINQAYDKENL